jgi:hypothetical protein
MRISNQVATLDEAKAELGELEAVEGLGGDGRNDPMNRRGVLGCHDLSRYPTIEGA